jgi:hypothetical protein
VKNLLTNIINKIKDIFSLDIDYDEYDAWLEDNPDYFLEYEEEDNG